MSASCAELVLVAPGEEPAAGPVIGHAGVLVADRGGEEFQEAARRAVAGVGDDRRHDDRGRDGGEIRGGLAAGTTTSS